MSSESPEVLIARRLISRLGIRPPILIDDIAREFADVEEVRLPADFDFDGISLFLKHRSRRARIILNTNRPKTRKRFTLAHELGHVLIPWHVGTIVDFADVESTEVDGVYAELEAQANKFASEFLMPRHWVLEVIASYVEPVAIVSEIAATAEVSLAAASIKAIQNMPPGIAYAHVLDDGSVTSSGRSEGTIARPPSKGSVIVPDQQFHDCASVASLRTGNGRYCWWVFHQSMELGEDASPRVWRELLDEIVDEVFGVREQEAKSIKASINGVLSNANSQVRGDIRSVGSVYSACLQRLRSNQKYFVICEHPLFEQFLQKRARSFFE